MKINEAKIDEMVLALLWLGRRNEYETWKGFDWGSLQRLHDQGLISNPVGKQKSIAFSQEGLAKSETLFKKHFTDEPNS